MDYVNLFNSIFSNLEVLSKNWNCNYKRISENVLHKNNQIIYSFDYTKYKLCTLKFEFVVYDNLMNKINVNSKNIYIKNIIDNQTSIIEWYKELYNEIDFVDIDCRLNANKFEIYTICSDENKLQNIFISGLVMNHFII